MNSQCSIALLESVLAGNMPAEQEESLHRHLEECESCNAALERMAGGATWCREAASLLIEDELDDTVPSREECSNVDFTVEHLEASDEPNVIGRLGGYDVLEIIGRGGMGVVLKGFDRELKRCVAIKVLSPHLAQSSLARKRFAREAQAAAAVVHPNVLAIHQVQPSGHLPFLVMPLVAGESLAERLTEQGRLELKETLRIGMQAAAGLAAAHEQGLVHRDVKPANILLEKGVERAVLTDFGLARAADDVSMTRWGIIAGTPQYMSPEQAQGEPLDGRSDLFSLGCVLYEMATGVSPFRADSTVATLRRLIDDPPPAMASLNPELPPWFIGIVDRLIDKDPSRRFGSAKEVSELLEGCLAHLQQPTSVPLPAALPAPAVRPVSKLRKNLWKGSIIMLATMGLALLGMFAMQATDPPDIAGRWSSEETGQLLLDQTSPGEYSGSYRSAVGKTPGKIEVRWSRLQRRFNGTWREGEDCFGELSLRLVDNELRGARTTDPKSKVDPATPRLADLVWKRAQGMVNGNEAQPPIATFAPEVEQVIRAKDTAEQPPGKSGPAQPALPYRRDLNKKWSLTRKDAIRYALSNSEVMHSIGVQVIALPESSTLPAGAASGSDKPIESLVGNDERVQIARLNTDISQVDFEAGVRNLVFDVESAYWELYFAHRNLDSVQTCRDLALETWRKVHARQNEGSKNGTAAEEAQAREQYFSFRSTGEQAILALYTADNKLRYMLGVAPTDDRLIRPSEEPTTAKVTFDETEIRGEALRRNIEIRRQRSRVEQQELEVAAAKDSANSDDYRRTNAGLKNAELAATKERAKLQEVELELSHALANDIHNLEADYALADRNFNRRKAAESNVDAVKTAYENGTIKFDVLLQSQRLRVQAESDYYRALVNYVKSIAMVHFRKGSLLEYEGVYLKEDSKGVNDGKVATSAPVAEERDAESPPKTTNSPVEETLAPPASHGRSMKITPADLARFASLPEDQQKAAMLDGMRTIQQKCANISLKTTTCISKVSGDPRKTNGAVTLIALGEFGTHAYELRRIGSSYRIEENVSYPKPRKSQRHIEHHDAESGVNQFLETHKLADGKDQNLARISKDRPGVGTLCAYGSYLGGLDFLEFPENDIFKFLLEHQSDLRIRGIDQQSRLVEASLTYTDEPAEKTVSWSVWLDLGKDWMLRRMGREEKFRESARAGEETYESFEVSESEQFDGVWLPTKVREITWSSRLSFGNLRETTAENIKIGSVKKEDLEIVFPPGTVVSDEITGDRWTVGLEEKTPVQENTAKKPEAKRPSSTLSPN